MKSVVFSFITAALLLLIGQVHGQASPNWLVSDVPELSVLAGQSLQGINQPTSPVLPPSRHAARSFEPSNSAVATAEVVQLAKGLNHDAWQIYRYCYDRIRHETYWGSKKGASLTMLEGSGNCFDTSSLMVSLLRISGFEDVEYRYGFLFIHENDLQDWLGVLSPFSGDGVPFPDLTSAQFRTKFSLPTSTPVTAQLRFNHLVSDYLFQRGYPVTEQIGMYWQIPHVWVRFKDSQGVLREMDPTFNFKHPQTYMEQYLQPTGSNFGYTRSTFLNNLGGTLAPGGKQITAIEVTTPTTGLNSQLATFTNGFQTWLRNNKPSSTTDQFINRNYAVPLSSTFAGAWLVPGLDYVEDDDTWLHVQTWNEIPTIWEAKVTFAFGTGYNSSTGEFATNYGAVTVPTSTLQGERLSLTFEGTTARLRLGDATDPVHEFTASGLTSVQMKIAVDHPIGYYNSSGDYVTLPYIDSSETKSYKWSNDSAYAILYGFDASSTTVKKAQDRLDGYRKLGLLETDWRMRTETLNVMGMTYLAQVRTIELMASTRTKTISMNWHQFGRFAQEESYYIDVGLATSGDYSYKGKKTDMMSSFATAGHFASALEHGVIEQMQGPSVSALSTMKVVKLANDQGSSLYLADNSNWSTLRPTLALAANGWPTRALDLIESSITGATNVANGAQVLLPQKGNIGLVASPPSGQWRGYGFALTSNAGWQMAISGGYASGIYSGGYASGSGTVSSSTVTAQNKTASGYYTLDMLLNPAAHAPTSQPQYAADPVDMASGAFIDQVTDLSCGQPVPRGLLFHRSYHSGRMDDASGLGFGWTHNLDITANRRSATRAALGETTPQQMAATYVAVAVALDVYANRTNAKDLAVTALTSCWAMDQLRDNGVSIAMGEKTFEFVKMPNGIYVGPAGCTMNLTDGAGSTLLLAERHGNTHTFAANGKITQTSDPYGNLATFHYNVDGRLDWVKDCYDRKLTLNWTGNKIQSVVETAELLTRSVQFGYTGDDLTLITDPEGDFFHYDYLDHRITESRDGLNRTIVENDYDDAGRVRIQRLHGDPAKTFNLFFSGRRNVERNPQGSETTFLYDHRGRATGVIGPEGGQSYMAYDGQDRVIESATPKNNGAGNNYRPKKITYNADQNIARIDVPKRNATDTLATFTTCEYDSQLRLWKEYEFKGKYTEYTYNSKHQILTIRDKKGVIAQTYTYNTDGTLETTKDADNKITTYSNYDAFGNPRTVTHPAITVNGASVVPTELFVYNSRGDQTSHTDCNANVTTTTYNGRRQLEETRLPAVGGVLSTKRIEYDAAGNAYRTRNAKGFWTYSEISQTGKLLNSVLPATAAGTAKIINKFDVNDRLEWSEDPLGFKTVFGYDPTGRLKTTTDPLNRAITQVYNVDGEVVETHDPRAKVTYTRFNWRGEPYELEDPMTYKGGTIFDANGLTASVVNKRTQSFVYGYDDNGNVTSLKTPLLRTANFGWNSRGLQENVVEPSTDRVDFTYDAMKRQRQAVFRKGGSVVATTDFDYDKNGNPKKVTETVGAVVRNLNYNTYDARNRLVSYTDARSQTIGYDYDANGNLTKLVYPPDTAHPTGKQVIYTYDALDRLQTVTDWAGRLTRYTYDIGGRLKMIQRPGGTTRRQTWSASGELLGFSELAGNGSPIVWAVNKFDPGGRKENEKSFPAPNPFTASSFDATFDIDNLLATFNGNSVVYDNDGNMTTGPLGGTASASYVYDSRNRLQSVGGFSYDYDPGGHRIGITTSAGLTKWTIDPNSKISRALVREKSDGSRTWYVYGLGLAYEVGGDNAIRTYHYDAQGSTRAIVAGDGATVVSRYDYDPFGRETWTTGTSDSPFRYNGAYGIQTDDNGLCYMRARYYSPQIRRFLNADPTGFNGGSNWHLFAAGNPIALADPLGLEPARHASGSPLYDMKDGGRGANPSTGQMGYVDAFGDWHVSFCMSCHDWNNPAAQRNMQATIGGDTGWWIMGRDLAMMLSPAAEMGLIKGATTLEAAAIRSAIRIESAAVRETMTLSSGGAGLTYDINFSAINAARANTIALNGGVKGPQNAFQTWATVMDTGGDMFAARNGAFHAEPTVLSQMPAGADPWIISTSNNFCGQQCYPMLRDMNAAFIKHSPRAQGYKTAVFPRQ